MFLGTKGVDNLPYVKLFLTISSVLSEFHVLFSDEAIDTIRKSIQSFVTEFREVLVLKKIILTRRKLKFM